MHLQGLKMHLLMSVDSCGAVETTVGDLSFLHCPCRTSLAGLGIWCAWCCHPPRHSH